MMRTTGFAMALMALLLAPSCSSGSPGDSCRSDSECDPGLCCWAVSQSGGEEGIPNAQCFEPPADGGPCH